MFRRRWLIVAGAFALLIATVSGAMSLPLDQGVTLGDRSAALTTGHVAAGVTAMRHKAGGVQRHLLRSLGTAPASVGHQFAIITVMVLAAATTLRRRRVFRALPSRAPPFLQI